MGTNNVFENVKRQKIGHYDFLKYPFFYDYIRIGLHGIVNGLQDEHFMACLLWQIYQRTRLPCQLINHDS